jgi:hypothetical protein
MKPLPMLCVPVGGSVPTRFFIFTQQWTPPEHYRQPPGHPRGWEIDGTPNRLDISRSSLLDRAMNLGRPCWQWDADVISFGQTYEEQIGFIEECVNKYHYDAVVAPHSNAGRVMIQPVDAEAVGPRPTQPFEIKGGFNGAWYMSLAGLAKLQEIGWHETSDGKRTPMFCTFAIPGPDETHPEFALTEDFDLSIRFRQAGGRICCDPRLTVSHLNKRDEVVNVAEMNRLEGLQRAAIEQHERYIREQVRKVAT